MKQQIRTPEIPVRFLTSPAMTLSRKKFSPSKQGMIAIAAALGLTGSIWGIEAMLSPSAVQAYTARVDLSLDRLADESYTSLIRRAELVARAAAQRSFDRDILASETSVIVTGRYGGLEAPILALNVSRVQWRSHPDAHRWATFYRNSATLLGFGETQLKGTPASPSAQPAVPQEIPKLTPSKLQTPLPPAGIPTLTPATDQPFQNLPQPQKSTPDAAPQTIPNQSSEETASNAQNL